MAARPGVLEQDRSIRGWTNIWEPWDPLAFYTSNVFKSDSGR